LCVGARGPEGIKNLNMAAIWNCSKAAGHPLIGMGHKGAVSIKA